MTDLQKQKLESAQVSATKLINDLKKLKAEIEARKERGDTNGKSENI